MIHGILGDIILLNILILGVARGGIYTYIYIIIYLSFLEEFLLFNICGYLHPIQPSAIKDIRYETTHYGK